MPVWLRNLQRTVVLNESMFKMKCCFLLNVFGAPQYDISIMCITNDRMIQLNKQYRGLNTPTDVLSFQYHEDLKPGTLPQPERECDFNLGDVIINIPYIRDLCIQDNVDLMGRLVVLVTHGLAHLLGYTHDTPNNAHAMISREKSVLEMYNNTFGRRLHPLTVLN